MTWWSTKIATELEQVSGYSTAGRVLTSNGGTSAPTWQAVGVGSVTQADLIAAGGVVVLASEVTPLTLTNDATVTDLLAYTIPANTLSAGRIIRVCMGGTYLNNSAATRAPVLAVTLPGGTLWGDTGPALAANAQASSWELAFDLACESSTLVHLRGRMRLSSAVAPTTGVGELTAPTGLRIDSTYGSVAAGVSVSALTSNRLLSVNFNHPTNTATQTLVRTHYTVELMP